MIKDYFVKVSWINPEQPLTRCMVNDVVSADITTDLYTFINVIKEQTCVWFDGRVENFTVDFMMEVGKCANQ